MTAARVTYANMFSQPRSNILALISNTSNVADPLSTSSEYRKWIYSRDPDLKDSNFGGYPYLIIHPSDTDVDEVSNCDLKSKRIVWGVEIEIVTSDRGYGSNDGQGLSHMDTLSNSVNQTLLNKTNRVTLHGYGMYFTTPETTAVVTEVNADELVYRRSIMIGTRGKLQVSV